MEPRISVQTRATPWLSLNTWWISAATANIDTNEAKRYYPSLASLLTIDSDNSFILLELVDHAIYTASRGVVAVDRLASCIVEPEGVDTPIDA